MLLYFAYILVLLSCYLVLALAYDPITLWGGADTNPTLLYTSDSLSDVCGHIDQQTTSTGPLTIKFPEAKYKNWVNVSCTSSRNDWVIMKGNSFLNNNTKKLDYNTFFMDSNLWTWGKFHFQGFTMESCTRDQSCITAKGKDNAEQDVKMSWMVFENTGSESFFGSGSALKATGNVWLDQCKFQDCTVGAHGGAVHTGRNITASNSEFLSCRSTGARGGALASDNVNVDSCTFSGCEADIGGAVSGKESVVATNSMFMDCKAGTSGGAIDGGYIWVHKTNFTECSSNRGGAISSSVYFENRKRIAGSVKAVSSKFSKCRSTEKSGGAIYSSGLANITDTKFFRCSSDTVDGGAVHSDEGDIWSKWSTYEFCSSSGEGGALYTDIGVITSEQDEFLFCNARWGGAICSNKNLTIKHSTFDNCHSRVFGGAALSENGTLHSKGNTFKMCSSERGGALVGYEIMSIDDTFSYCTAIHGGAAIFGGNFNLYGFDNNRSVKSSMKVKKGSFDRTFPSAIYSNGTKSLTLDECKFTNGRQKDLDGTCTNLVINKVSWSEAYYLNVAIRYITTNQSVAQQAGTLGWIVLTLVILIIGLGVWCYKYRQLKKKVNADEEYLLSNHTELAYETDDIHNEL